MQNVDKYIKIIQRAKALFDIQTIDDPQWCAFLEKCWDKYMKAGEK